jgi:hypothetical protein
LALAVLGVLACGCGTRPASPAAAPPTPLHLAPACDLAPGAGLVWVADVKARAIAQTPELIPVVGALVPEARFDAYARAHGGIDVRQVEDLCVARYRASTLVTARVPLSPARVETAFAERATTPPRRTVLVANPPVVQLDADVLGEPQHLAIFGREALVLETGGLAALRASEAFALGKLKKSPPALATRALGPVVAALGEAPVRILVPGPFEGDAARGLGGLLRATTAVGLSARHVGPGGRILVRLVLAGAWGGEGEAAAERLAAAVDVLSQTALGRVLGVNEPAVTPVARAAGDALVLEATVDGVRLARGAHDVLEGDIGALLRR